MRLVIANLLAFVVTILAVEVAMRLFAIHVPALAEPNRGDRSLWCFDRTKGWALRPKARGQSFLGGPDKAIVETNSHGFRGPEFHVRKPAGFYRIVVLGDSFVFGHGVDQEHTFPSQLQNALAMQIQSVEVINLGISGYSTDQELLLFREFGAALGADLVVLVVCDNDFQANTEDFAYGAYYKPYFVLTPGLSVRNVPVPELTAFQEVKLALARHSNVWNLFRTRRSSIPAAQAFFNWFAVAETKRSGGEPIAVTMSIVQSLHDEAAGVGAAFFLMNTGHRGENTPLFWSLRGRLRAAGIRFLGLEGNLKEARERHPTGEWDFDTDTHWNVDSHRLAAAVVAEYMKINQLPERP